MLTSIETYAFWCTSITSIDLSKCTALASIGSYAFNGCSLKAVDLPGSLTSIGDYAFSACTDIETLTVRAEEPPTIYENTFLIVSKSIPVYVPDNSVDAYKAADYWEEFFNIQGMNESGGSGIDSAAPLASKVIVNGLEVELSVEAGTQVSVYSVSGQLVLKTTASRFTLPSAGIYIISAGGEAIKVAAQ